MKSFFKILIFVLTLGVSQASKIDITYESGNLENAMAIKSIFEKKYSVPEKLILIKEGKCKNHRRDKRFLNLCINKKGDLIKISQDIKFKINSLLSFR